MSSEARTAPTEKRSRVGVSKRLGGLQQSDIRRMTRECERVGGINLGQGICDLPTPPLVAAGAIRAIEERRSTYSFPEGTAGLRRAIADKLARDNGIAADPATDIVVTVGATGAFTAAIHALLDPGDGIVLFEPYYGYHLNAAIVAGLEPQLVRPAAPAFRVEEAALEAAIGPRTRAIVACTPANPSGRMLDESELAAVARVAERHDLLVITDEIYEYIRYDGRRHASPATVPGLAERTVTIMGLSKTFSITGWRLGYAVAPAHLARPITLVNDLFYVCAPTPLQHGAEAGFAAPRDFFSSLQTDYQKKRDLLCDALAKAQLAPIVPEGAYYVLVDASRLGCATAKEAAMTLLERARVASVPGSAFYFASPSAAAGSDGAPGERLLRFCFAKEDDVLAEACRRIASL